MEGRYINYSSIMQEAERQKVSKNLPFTVTKNDVRSMPLYNPKSLTNIQEENDDNKLNNKNIFNKE